MNPDTIGLLVTVAGLLLGVLLIAARSKGRTWKENKHDVVGNLDVTICDGRAEVKPHGCDERKGWRAKAINR